MTRKYYQNKPQKITCKIYGDKEKKNITKARIDKGNGKKIKLNIKTE